MKNLYILGEESPSQEIAAVLYWFSGITCSTEISFEYKEVISRSDASRSRLRKINNYKLPIFGFELVNYTIPGIDKIYYILMSKTGNSMVDYLLYEGKIPPKVDSIPLAACEATKNGAKDSGNMSDQRAGKFIPVIEKWGKNVRCAYLINAIEPIDDTIDGFMRKQSHNCAFATMNAIGVEVIISQIGKSYYKPYKVPFVYNTIQSVIENENKKVKKVNSSCIIKIDENTFSINANLVNGINGNPHDPNEGYVMSRAYLVRKLSPEAKIEIDSHNESIYYFNKENNKLINVLRFVKVTAVNLVTDSNPNIKKPTKSIKLSPSGKLFDCDKIFDKSYWKYTDSGEKLSSIVLEQIYIHLGYKIVFSNHAGCQKSYIEINGKYYITKKKEGIPDLVAYDPKTKKLFIIEAKVIDQYREGINQVNSSQTKEFIENELLNRFEQDQINKVVKSVCTFTDQNDGALHRDRKRPLWPHRMQCSSQEIFNLTANGLATLWFDDIIISNSRNLDEMEVRSLLYYTSDLPDMYGTKYSLLENRGHKYRGEKL